MGYLTACKSLVFYTTLLAPAVVQALGFRSQLQACPQACSIVGPSATNWTVYHSLDRLQLCGESVLFDFNIFNTLQSPGSHDTIRACMADDAPSINQSLSPSCVSAVPISANLQALSWGSDVADSSTVSLITDALEALQHEVAKSKSCDNSSKILFAQSADVVTGLYVGSSIDSVAATASLAQSIIDQSKQSGSFDGLAAQVCGGNYDGSSTLGLIVSSKNEYGIVQDAIQRWANATCIDKYDRINSKNVTFLSIPPVKHAAAGQKRADTCSYVLVVSGDSCGSLASKCGITAAEFTEYNPSPTLCSTLAIGEPVCCSAGSLPDLSPQPSPDGLCYSYTVQSGDYCSLLAQEYYLTTDQIEQYNAQTWGWMGCNDLQLGANICLSTGDPPMPATVSNAECGPQVAGTARPSDWSNIGLLNPCPINACCDIWGQCGITPDFCTTSESTTKAPGTAASGSNGCVSNCGVAIVNNEAEPTEFKSIGYFEAFNDQRPCLNMDASQIPSSYSHVHFAFGQIGNDFQVDISDSLSQFEVFANQSYFKRILTFGGWSFSTSLDSYPIFREGVTDANRLTFAQSVASLVEQYGLDGVDFDWEYPGATDLPGVPPGSPSDGPNYLSFLQTLRSILPSNKTISMAAPASYWYLQNFPIANMSEVLDYIVFMTYDLHGQWDWNSTYTNPGCPTGNCLRSHVNLTETEYALSMITKAGVPAQKVVVGLASYGRSFGMVDPSCTGPDCLFTGPNSTATPGDCTGTAGYIAKAELDQLSDSAAGSLERRAVSAWHDNSSDSDMMTYGDGTWVSYMSDETKASRINLYAGYHFGGTIEWALDLSNFLINDTAALGSENITALEDSFSSALALSNYNISEFTTYNVTDLATRLIGWDGCDKRRGFDPNQIYSGWQQSWKLMNYVYKSGIDFNEAAAVEFFGPPAYLERYMDNYRKIFNNIATIQPGYVFDPIAWRIAVRCDNWVGDCDDTIAYTTNKDPKYGVAGINFCPEYFLTATLDQQMTYTDKNTYPEIWADLRTYGRSQADVWFHELLHINWVSLAKPDGPNERVVDLKMRFGTETIVAYGVKNCKALARYVNWPYGPWTIQNADSLTFYALAKYVQSKLGNVYPHLPLAPQPPSSVSPKEFNATDIFAFTSDGTLELPSNMTHDNDLSWSLDEGTGALGDDLDGGTDPANIVTIIDDFAVDTAYPTDYMSSWSSWAGLTPTTTSTAPTPTASWIISIYSENGCTGDYYVVEGYNYGDSNVQCLDFQSLPLNSETGATCGWYTNGGASFTGCSSSNLTQPLSWRVKSGGSCTVFADSGCSMSDDWQGYSPSDGCHDYTASDSDVQNWAALKCSADPPGNGPLHQPRRSSLTPTRTSARPTVPLTMSTSMRVTATPSQ